MKSFFDIDWNGDGIIDDEDLMVDLFLIEEAEDEEEAEEDDFWEEDDDDEDDWDE